MKHFFTAPRFLLSTARRNSYEGEGASGASGASGATGAGNTGPDPAQKFTQDEVNRVLAADRRKHQEAQRKLAEELEGLRNSARMTAEEKEALAAQIDELQKQYLTKEELAKRAAEKAAKEQAERQKSLTSEVENWKNRYTKERIGTTITHAAVKHEAFSPVQIQAILGPMTRLVEVVGADGKPSGEFEPKVMFPDVDKEGKSITLELDVDAAVARMKELPEAYGNLFKGSKSGGVGQDGSGKPGKKVDIVKLAKEDPAGYRKLRKEHPEAFQ